MFSCNTAVYTILVFYFSPLSSKNTHLVSLKLAEIVNHSGKKIIVYMCWKSDNHIWKILLYFWSAKTNLSLNVDITYGFAVNSEWKKKEPSLKLMWNMTSDYLNNRNPDEHIWGESKTCLKAKWDGVTL